MGSAKILEKRKTVPEKMLEEYEKLAVEGFTHLVAITALDRGELIEVIYHFSSPKGSMAHLSLEISKNGPVLPTLTGRLTGAAFYEREAEDLFGVRFEDIPKGESPHFILPDCYPTNALPPLLKNVKPEEVKQNLAVAQSCNLQAFSSTGPISPESVVFPLGPYHPALKEPEYFSLVVEGETIQKAFLRIGYVHRGIEKAAEGRTYLRDIFLLERICGICSTHHAWTFVEAVEKLLNLEVSERAKYLRTLIAELERIHSHSLWLGLVGYWMGFETMFMWVWNLRETVMDLLEEATGNRVHKSFVTIGGVRRDIPDSMIKRVSAKVNEFTKQIELVLEAIVSTEQFVERTTNIGAYSLEQARKYLTVGPVRRAAGDPYDIRKVEPYGAYEELDFEVVTSSKGDVYNLILCRLRELMESAKIISQIAEKTPSGNPIPQRYFMGTVPSGEAYARTEAPRGELFYYVNSNNTHTPYRVKIRTPTLPNIQLAASLLEGASLSDLPLILTCIDPCFSCMDRVQVYNSSDKTVRILTLEDFARKMKKGEFAWRGKAF